MKQKFIFTLLLVLSLSSNLFGESNDTLKWEVCSNFYYSNYNIENLDNKKFDIIDNPSLLLTFCLSNLSKDIYLKGSNIKFSFTLTFPNGKDTSMNIIYCFEIDFSPTTEDTVVIILDKVKFILKDTGTYKIKTKVISTDKDGIFSDSIQELSSRTSYFYVINSVCIEESNIINTTIYPNPATNSINIYNEQALIKSVNLYTISGQQVKQVVVNSMKTTLDVSNLPAGMYIAKINTEQEILTRKVQVVR